MREYFRFSRVRLSATLWAVAHQAPVHGILQARILELVAISFSRDLPDPGIKPVSPALQADSLPAEPPGKLYHLELSHLSKTKGETHPDSKVLSNT